MSSSLFPHPLSRALSNKPVGPMRSPARVLGWFSIGLGVAELLVPRAMARAAGTPAGPKIVRAHGLREIGVGIGLLNSRDPAPWLAGRVAGDAIDLATVAPGLLGPKRTSALVSLALLAGVTWLDTLAAKGAAKGPRRAVRDYADRSGFPKPASEMRGVAAGATRAGRPGPG